MESPRESADRECKQGLAYLDSGKYESALKCFDSAIEKYPHGELYLRRSECNEALGKYVCALTNARNAMELNPESDEAKRRSSYCVDYLENVAMEKLISNDVDGCIALIEEFFEKFEQNNELVLIKIRCLIIKNRRIEAEWLNEICFAENFYEAFELYYDGNIGECSRVIEVFMENSADKYSAVYDVREKLQLVKGHEKKCNFVKTFNKFSFNFWF